MTHCKHTQGEWNQTKKQASKIFILLNIPVDLANLILTYICEGTVEKNCLLSLKLLFQYKVNDYQYSRSLYACKEDTIDDTLHRFAKIEQIPFSHIDAMSIHYERMNRWRRVARSSSLIDCLVDSNPPYNDCWEALISLCGGEE